MGIDSIKTFASYASCIPQRVKEGALDEIRSATQMELALQRTINLATLEVLAPHNIDNYKSNSQSLKAGKGIYAAWAWDERKKRQEPHWLDQPCVIVAAGPSLSRNGSDLIHAKGHIPILAVDAALPMLIDLGVEPDFVMVIDTTAKQTKFWAHIAEKVKRRITMLAIACCHPDVLRTWPAESLYFFNSSGESADEEIQLEYGQDFGSLPIGGNVSTGLHSFAKLFLGCDPIIMVGHDFAYPCLDEYYARGGITDNIPRSKKQFRCVDVYGRPWMTDLSLWSYKSWFERDVRRWKEYLPGARWINATEGGVLGCTEVPGLMLPQMEYIPLKQALCACGISVGENDKRSTHG